MAIPQDLTLLLHNLGFGFAFKKSQADIVARIMSDENVQYFKVRKCHAINATELLIRFRFRETISPISPLSSTVLVPMHL